MDRKELIEHFRIKKGLSKKALAEKAGIPATTLYSFLGRKGDGLGTATFEALAKALDIPSSLIYSLIPIPFDEGVNDDGSTYITIPEDVANIFDGALLALQDKQQEEKVVLLLDHFEKLNPTGQEKAVTAVEDLAKVPEYQKED